MTGEQISYASRLRLPVWNLNGRRLNADYAVGDRLQTYARHLRMAPTEEGVPC